MSHAAKKDAIKLKTKGGDSVLLQKMFGGRWYVFVSVKGKTLSGRLPKGCDPWKKGFQLDLAGIEPL